MKYRVKSVLLALVATFMGAMLLNGCNTVKGFGQDMQQGGKALQEEAQK